MTVAEEIWNGLCESERQRLIEIIQWLRGKGKIPESETEAAAA